jgi:1-deoxy-D-xylulose-5-phosphate reductoisomerase
LRLAYEAIQTGGTMPTILNAANEIAVDAFLNEQIRFTDIPVVIEKTMQMIPMQIADSLETILATDKQARVVANQAIQGLKNS